MSEVSRLLAVDLDDWVIVVDPANQCVVSANHSVNWPALAPFELVRTIYPYEDGSVADGVTLSGHESYADLLEMGLIPKDLVSGKYSA